MTYDPKTAGDRRSPGAEILQVLLHVEQNLEKKVGELTDRLTSLSITVENWIDESKLHQSPCASLLEAVPDKDLILHRKRHEEDLRWDKQLSDLKWVVVKAVAASMAIGFLVWGGASLWVSFLKGPA